MKVRCGWHCVIGAGLPFLPIYLPDGFAYMLGGIALYIAYQMLQCKYLTNHQMHQRDDSFKDIFELAVPFGISTVVLIFLKGLGVL